MAWKKPTDEEMLAYWKGELQRFKTQEEDNVITRDNIKIIKGKIKTLKERIEKRRMANSNKKPAVEQRIIVEVRKPRPNPFEGADDIYVTKNKIAVTKTKKSSAKRGYTKTTQTKYYAQNDSNLKQLKAVKGDTVRVGRKGNNYKRI